MWNHRRAALTAACAVSLVSASVAPRARADTLAEAITLAYQTNPTLQSQRAALRAIDEDLIQAESGLRPTATLTGEAYGSKVQDPVLPFGGPDRRNSGELLLTLTQPLYTGGRTANERRQAIATIKAGVESLRATEASVFLSVIQSYVDVRRDQEIAGIRAAYMGVIGEQLKETRARQEVGDVTKTDVAQIEVQLDQARILLTQAQAQLQASRTAYLVAVGRNPDALDPEPPLTGLPATVDQAFDLAQANNANLLQAQQTELESRASIGAAKAAFRPTVSLQGQLQFGALGGASTIDPFHPGLYRRTLAGYATVTQPLYAAGMNASNVRRAQAQNDSDYSRIEITRRQVVAAVANAWNQALADHASTSAAHAQTRAADATATGMREEYRGGLRSTFDVLYAEQVLRDARITEIETIHDDYVAQANILSLVGALEARNIIPNARRYDPNQHLRQITRWDMLTPWGVVIDQLDALGAPGAGTAVAKPQTTPRPGTIVVGDDVPATPAVKP
jgi:outer membrane protein